MKHEVLIPITGLIYVEVEADSEREAIEKALNSDLTTDDISEWDLHEYIVQGNVFYGMQNEAEVTCSWEEEDE